MEEEHHFTCPHCWQTISMMLDVSRGGQRYIEDCEVCCNPLEIAYDVQDGAIIGFDVQGIEQ